MKQISFDQVMNLINHHDLIPSKNAWLICQETGSSKVVLTEDIWKHLKQIKDAVFLADDDGMLRVVTLDIHFNQNRGNLYTGSVFRLILRRKEKRIQSRSGSNGVGAPRIDHDCILCFTNN